MFNSTHTLAGIALSRTGLDRLAPYATCTAVIAANLPDIDILTGLDGTATYLDHHRGITHSLIGILLLSLILSLSMSWFTRLKNRPAPFYKHFAIALLVMATHPLLDWMNSYGLRPFLPFDGTWYRGDILFVIDPYLDLILLTAVLWRPRAFVLAALLYIGGMTGLHRVADHHLRQFQANSSGVLRSAVLPIEFNPFRWTGFLETSDGISRLSIDVVSGRIHQLDQFSKGQSTPATAVARSTYTGKVFDNFARFAIIRTKSIPLGYRVLMTDYQFFRANAGTALAAEVLVRKDLTIESESLSFTRPVE